MIELSQSPTDPGFVQNPYPFYELARATPFFHWTDYGMTCTGNAAACNAIFRDRRFGREAPLELAPVIPDHLKPFYAVEAHSMLELEPPRHTRLRGLVLRAFTSRRIAALLSGNHAEIRRWRKREALSRTLDRRRWWSRRRGRSVTVSRRIGERGRA